MSTATAIETEVLGLTGTPVGYDTALAEARAWLARELHDGAVQRLNVMVVELEGLRRRAGPELELEQLQRSTRAALGDLRKLLYDLRDEPAVDSGLVSEIRELLAELTGLSGIVVDLVIQSWPDDLPFTLSANLRRIAGEALANVRRHSGASRVTVTLQALYRSLAITVADDGRGLAGTEGGFGLQGMRERARLLGGRIILQSPPEGGTIVRCIVPWRGSR